MKNQEKSRNIKKSQGKSSKINKNLKNEKKSRTIFFE